MLTTGDKKNFKTLCRAVQNHDVCIMECTRKSDGKEVALVCAVQRDPNSGLLDMVPLAVMVEGNPYELYEPATAAPELHQATKENEQP